MTTPRIEVGDITRMRVDAVVNAANEALSPGGGVCGAIHAAAGPELARACAALGGCPTGGARITPGFELAASYIIHAVGPVYRGGDAGEAERLASCYRASLELASERGLASIAFPAIGTGIYGYPLEDATKIALSTILTWLRREKPPTTIICCCFTETDAETYRHALAELTA